MSRGKTIFLLLTMLLIASTAITAYSEPTWNIQGIDRNDPELRRAKEQAQKRWPLFLSEFQASKTKADFMVKLPLADGKNVEHVWIAVDKISGDKIVGKLDNEPVDVRGYKSGQQISINRSLVEDWSFPQGNKQIGGWSVAVFLKRHPEMKSPQFPVYVQPK